jgi:glycosyltransferase involved in cell wall biosynthesis
MKIAITTPGRFPPAFHAARYHDARGELARIVSPVPPSRAAQYGISPERHVGLTVLGAWNHAAIRFGPEALQEAHQTAFSAAFDEIAWRIVAGAGVVYAWQSTALRTIRAAHRHGVPAVLEAASAHVLTQVDLLRQEQQRYGAALDRVVRSPRVIDRTLAEYEEADHIIANSEFARASFVSHGIPASKVTAVRYAIDAREIGADPPPREHGVPRILFVGGLTLRKGIPYLLDAFRRIDAAATLRLVGAPHPALIAACGGLPRGAEIAGVRAGAALAAEYAAADIFVLPSVEDGFGLVVLEAMLAGLPVVVSDHAGAAAAVHDGVDGYVIPARDADALAARLTTLAADPGLRRRMGAAALASVVRRTWDDYGAERHRRVCAPLLGLHLDHTEVRDVAAA